MLSSSVKVDLPGSALYDECYLQTFTLGDAEILPIVQKTGDTKQLYELINSRLNLSVYDLTLQDLWFILHWQRINSYPNYPMNLPWDCPNCSHSNVNELSGSSLVIDDLDPKYKHGITVDLPSIGKTKLRLPLVKDEEVAKRYLRDLRITNPDPKLFKEVLRACLLEPNGGTLDDNLKLVQTKLTADDGFVINGFEQYFEYGVKDFAKFTCQGCGEVSKVRFKFDLTTFFPRVSHSSDIRARILFSETPEPANRESEHNGLGESSLHSEAPLESFKTTEGQAGTNESKTLDDVIRDR